MAFCACCVCVFARVWCLSVRCLLPLSFSVCLPPAAWHFLCFLSPAITAGVNTYSWQPFSPSPFYFSPSLSSHLSSFCLSLTIHADASLSLSLTLLSLSSPHSISLSRLLISLWCVSLSTLLTPYLYSFNPLSPLHHCSLSFTWRFKTWDEPPTSMEGQRMLSRVELIYWLACDVWMDQNTYICFTAAVLTLGQ